MQSSSGTEEENSVSSLESSLARVTVSGQSLPSLHTVTCSGDIQWNWSFFKLALNLQVVYNFELTLVFSHCLIIYIKLR